MRKHGWKAGIVCSIIALCSCSNSSKEIIDPGVPPADTPLVKVGTYYFGGWYEGSHHLRPALVNDYPERQPTWGWVTSTPENMKNEIDAAAAAGIHFFNFCWYFNTQDFTDNRPATNAIKLFLAAPNKNKLKFSLLVANHAGYYITPASWPKLKEYWKALFKEPNYLMVDGKPLVTFFDYSSFVTNFGGAANVKLLMDEFRNEVKAMGFNGITIAGCASPTANSIKNATDCGFDLLTGYNYHSSGFSANTVTPIADMYQAEISRLWPAFKAATIPYIPVATLNWDNRPWSDNPATEKIFAGYSKASVKNSVTNLKQWILDNPANTTKEKIGLLYAWNEYGEGAWLTPSAPLKDSLLQGVKEGLK